MGNIMPGTKKIGSGNYIGESKYAYGKYDFATLGGAVGAITLTGDTIPSGAVVLDSIVLADTLLTSGGAATVALSVESAADVQAAVAFNAAPFTVAGGAKHGSALTATGNPVVTTAVRPIVATVAAAALTAGTFRVIVEYMEVLP